MSIPCVLVTPKRKLAGRLAIMRKFLHFFGEFLVEGTGGSSVFTNLNSSGNFEPSKPEQLGLQKQNFINLDSERRNASDSINSVHGGLQKHFKNIKRHWRWDICKVLYLLNN